jgi:hypothetical protein
MANLVSVTSRFPSASLEAAVLPPFFLTGIPVPW